jgi:hypothetical protein
MNMPPLPRKPIKILPNLISNKLPGTKHRNPRRIRHKKLPTDPP